MIAKMMDQVGHAHVVSNSSSHNSFVGLAGNANDEQYNSQEMSSHHVNNPLAGRLPFDQNTPDGTMTSDTGYQKSQIAPSRSPLPILPSSGLAVPSTPNNNTVPEFLYQLTKMLTGGHNDIIEWSNGRIEVHNPHKLESLVLQKYFRHSKFASFQRQLNYFGFRKLAGKGKMAPCSYVNDAATNDIGSLLLIKRKVGPPNPKDKNGRRAGSTGKDIPKSTVTNQSMSHAVRNTPYVPSKPAPRIDPADGSQQAIARSAVGRGVRHSFSLGTTDLNSSTALGVQSIPKEEVSNDTTASNASTAAGSQSIPNEHVSSDTNFVIPRYVEDSLSQLTSNYQSSLAGNNPTVEQQGSNDGFPSLLSRNSSLIDLAMLPNYEEEDNALTDMPGFNFVDFPQPELDPSYYPNQGDSSSSA